MPLKNKIPAQPTIAISRTDGLGDVILTLPIANWIRENFPKATIIFFCKSYTAPVVRLCPAIDHIVHWDELAASPEKIILETIQSLKIDIFIHAFPQHQLAKIVKQADIKSRIGTAGRFYNWLYCNQLIFFSRSR
jgi:ADP-heptose:LPS heptosyltransferase